jgi:hypothetical protein
MSNGKSQISNKAQNLNAQQIFGIIDGVGVSKNISPRRVHS